MNYRRRARELDAFVRGSLKRLPIFDTTAQARVVLGQSISVSGFWDDDFSSQKKQLIRLASMAILDLRKVVLEGGGDPNSGFKLDPVQVVDDDDDEFQTRYTLYVSWHGSDLDIDKVVSSDSITPEANPETRDAMIRRYLDESEEDESDSG